MVVIKGIASSNVYSIYSAIPVALDSSYEPSLLYYRVEKEDSPIQQGTPICW
jgi:hypothetical protein